MSAQTIYKGMFVDPIQNEFPNNWSKSSLGEISYIGAGGDRPAKYSNLKTLDCPIPIYSNGMDNEGLYGYTDKAKVFEESVTVSARGTIGYTCLRQEPYVPIVRLISVTPSTDKVTAKYLYFFLKNSVMNSTGTSQQQITVPDFKKIELVVPDGNSISLFSQRVEPLFKKINENKAEILQLMECQSVLLSQLSSH